MNILIAQPHEVIRCGLHTIFAEDPRVLNICEAVSHEDLYACILSFQPDLIVIDQSLIRDVTLLKKKNFVVLTSEPDLITLRRMYSYGALGYLSFNVSAEILRTFLRYTKNSFLIEPTLDPWIMEAIIHTIGDTSQYQMLTCYKKRRPPFQHKRRTQGTIYFISMPSIILKNAQMNDHLTERGHRCKDNKIWEK